MKGRTEPSFFEGTEKKIEFVVRSGGPSLRDRGEAWWSEVARRADAQVLSRIGNASCDAYLLSESSLFVWDHKVLMITCGRTRLTDAAIYLLDEIGPDTMEMFVYQRKNELFPHEQATSFFDDADRLSRRVVGRAFRFGDEDSHHLHLFHLDRPYDLEPEDSTVEILMYGLDPDVRRRFEPGSPPDGRTLCETIGLDRILPGFEIDDHLFEPRGYSLNAIKAGRYLTVHVTPDEISSYASLETNARIGENLDALLAEVSALFKPRSFDLVTWERGATAKANPSGYRLGSLVEHDLSCGYRVVFRCYSLPPSGLGRAIELPLTGEGTG